MHRESIISLAGAALGEVLEGVMCLAGAVSATLLMSFDIFKSLLIMCFALSAVAHTRWMCHVISPCRPGAWCMPKSDFKTRLPKDILPTRRVPQWCFAKGPHRKAPQECLTRVSSKRVQPENQECLTKKVSNKGVVGECPTIVSRESVLQNCPTNLCINMSDQGISAMSTVYLSLHCSHMPHRIVCLQKTCIVQIKLQKREGKRRKKEKEKEKNMMKEEKAGKNNTTDKSEKRRKQGEDEEGAIVRASLACETSTPYVKRPPHITMIHLFLPGQLELPASAEFFEFVSLWTMSFLR